MNSELPFPHHDYRASDVVGASEMISAEDAAVEDLSPSELGSVARRLRRAQVAEIILIHGTFAGNDVLGLLRELARVSPRLATAMKTTGKQVFDQLAGDVGNYTSSFAERFSCLINTGDQEAIPVTRFHWSGENHHLGRAGGVISLLDYIIKSGRTVDERILLWGHSHGGNLLAMLSLLVGASRESKERFFDLTRAHYRDPILGRLDLPQWESVRQQLSRAEAVADLPELDVATFGTPLRYRWNTEVCGSLVHFVQHRPLSPRDPTKASIPTRLQEIMTAAGGDYVQQLGIGGTDFLHSALAWRSWNVERRLRRLFAPSVRRRDLARNLKQGRRVSADGTTLLVDYPDTQMKWNQKLIGHGVYTRPEWLPFHLREITSRFYPE